MPPVSSVQSSSGSKELEITSLEFNSQGNSCQEIQCCNENGYESTLTQPSTVAASKDDQSLVLRASGYLLDRFEDLGHWVASWSEEPKVETAENAAGAPTSGASAHEDFKELRAKNGHIVTPSSRLMKGLSKAGSVIDAVTGVFGVAEAFAKDRDAGNDLLPRTMFKIISTTAQTGIVAGAAAATIAALGVGAPILGVVGATVAVGSAAGYIAGRIFDSLEEVALDGIK